MTTLSPRVLKSYSDWSNCSDPFLGHFNWCQSSMKCPISVLCHIKSNGELFESLIFTKCLGNCLLTPSTISFILLGHPLFFLHLSSNAFPDIELVGRIEKKNLKKNHKKSRNSRPRYPRTTLKVNIHIFGLTKCTIYCEKCSCFCSCFSLCCYYAHFSDKKNYFK